MSDAPGHSCGLVGLSRKKSGRIIHAMTPEEGVGLIADWRSFEAVVELAIKPRLASRSRNGTKALAIVGCLVCLPEAGKKGFHTEHVVARPTRMSETKA